MEFRVLTDNYNAKDGLIVLIVVLLTICAYSLLCIIVNTFHLLYLKRVKLNIRKENVLPDGNYTNDGEENGYYYPEVNTSLDSVYARKKKLF